VQTDIRQRSFDRIGCVSHTVATKSFMPTKVGIHVFPAAISKDMDGGPSPTMTGKARSDR
jgi:hypothetical protein